MEGLGGHCNVIARSAAGYTRERAASPGRMRPIIQYIPNLASSTQEDLEELGKVRLTR